MNTKYIALQIGRFKTFASLDVLKSGLYKVRYPIIDYRDDANGTITHKDLKVALEQDQQLIDLAFDKEINLSCALSTIFGNNWVYDSQETLKKSQGIYE